MYLDCFGETVVPVTIHLSAQYGPNEGPGRELTDSVVLDRRLALPNTHTLKVWIDAWVGL